jgi:GT2 family glycosyltransferase
MMEGKVLISILNWNNFENTISCIRSVYYLQWVEFETVVVDNDSNDNSVQLLRNEIPELKIIQLNENGGYASAHKTSADYAIKNGFKFLWILNNDLLVKADSLNELLKACQRNGLGIYGSLVLEAEIDDIINFAGGWELSKNGGLDYATPYNQYMGKSWPQYQSRISERKVADINGCSVLIPLDIIEKYGFMSDIFFLYKEETDYCFSLLEKGVPSYIVPTSVVVHKSGGSFVNDKLRLLKTYYSERNLILFMKRHPKYFVPYRNPLKKYRPLGESIISLLGLILKGKVQSQEFYKNLGIFHTFLGITGKYFAPEKYL